MINITSWAKVLALFFLGAVMLSSLTLCAYQIVAGVPVTPMILVVLSTGLGYSLNLLGFNQATSIANTAAQLAASTAGITAQLAVNTATIAANVKAANTP